MAHDLTLTGATYNASGKYGQSLSGGIGTTTDVFVGLTSFTMEGWVKTSATGATRVAFGGGGNAWVGIDSSGQIRSSYGNTSAKNINGIATLNDGAWHHIALCVSPSGGQLFLDGVSIATNTAADATTTGTFAVRRLGSNTSFDWVGEVDEVAISSYVKYTGNFTPAPVSDSQPNLRAVWHLDGNGTNSAGAGDTTAPTATAAAVANGAPTVVAITMSENMDAAAVPAASAFTVSGHTVSSVGISGTVINLTCGEPFVNGEAARTVSYTQPGTNNARDAAGNLLANFSGLAITNNVGASDTTAPAFVSAQVTNSQPAVIVLTFNETLASSTPPASAFAVSGGRTVSSVAAPSGTTIAVTVNSAYANGDAITVAYTQPGANPRLQDAAGNATATFAAQPVTNNVQAPVAGAYDPARILFSPANWHVTSTAAKAVNGGAYFETIYGGNTCTLNFDMTGVLSPVPKVRYRVDEYGPWTESDLAASITVTTPAATAGYGSHFLEFHIRSTSEAVERWNTQGTAVVLVGVVLAAGKSLTMPPERQGPKGLVLGDSIPDGINAVTNVGDATVRGDTTLGFAYQLRDQLGAEIGVVGFGGQGWNDTGGGNVPTFVNTWDKIYPGAPRSFVGLRFILIAHGTNDGNSNTVAQVTTVLNGLIAATTPDQKIIVLRPFNGSQAANIQAGIAASSAPARVHYVDTTGFYNSANSSDVVHPYGWEHVTHIAPAVAGAVRAILDGAPQLTTRTGSITLGEVAGPAANLAGAMVAVFDEPTPNLFTVPRFQTSVETADASGVMTFTFGSTLASGGLAGIVIKMPDGRHYNGTVTVT